MVNKRKRDDSNDSDADEIAPGKQNLPVANLPYDFDQEPQDGMEYLFLVRYCLDFTMYSACIHQATRRDARRLPHVTRVRNPYEVPETKVAPTSTPLATNVLPCEEWRIAFQTHFSNLRKVRASPGRCNPCIHIAQNLAQETIHVDHAHSGSTRRVIPEKKDRDAWWKFLAGYPESAWSPWKKPAAPHRMRTFSDSFEVVHPEVEASFPAVESRNEPSHHPIPCLRNSPQNVSPQPISFDTLRTAESISSTPLAADPSKSTEIEEPVKQLSPPEITPSRLREIDHVWPLFLNPILD